MNVTQMSPAEFLAVPSTSLPSARFVDENESWRADVWDVLRECARDGISPREAYGTDVLVWSDEWAGARLIGVRQ